MPFIWRFLALLGWRSKFVGRDLYGNKFYEYPSTTDDPRRTRRMVKYLDKGKITEYAIGGLKLPVQWSAWLAHTRRDPPSVEELLRDDERQRIVRHNAEILAIRDETSHRLEITDAEDKMRSDIVAAPMDRAQGLGISNPSEPSFINRNPLPKKTFQTAQKPTTPDADYSPQSWSPATRRGR